VPIILAYWRRYCPSALARGDVQTLARVHNGGPKWYATAKRRAATLTYWRKVQVELAGQRSSR
jgi:TfoX/Sxy family transcriptional regulator of competence genes